MKLCITVLITAKFFRVTCTPIRFLGYVQGSFPVFYLMYPEVESKIMEGLVNAYKESGWLPEWASPASRLHDRVQLCSLIADAYIKVSGAMN